MTQAEFADHRGVSRPRINRLMSRLKDHGCVTDTGRINVAKADEHLNDSLDRNKRHEQQRRPRTEQVRDPASGRALSIPEGMTESKARTISSLIRSKLDDIKLKKQQGKLLDAAEVEEAAFNRARSIRDAGMTLPEKISDQLAVMDNAFEIRLLLRKEIAAIFQGEVDKHA